LQGRQLKPGDLLSAGHPVEAIGHLIRTRLPDRLRPHYDRSITLRVIPGPQQEYFSKDALPILTGSSYSIAPQSDRMGYRLTGPKIVRAGSARFISDGTAMGALQIPPDGQPILLMADRQTTGGYPKIAVVISADLPLAAQLMPGDIIQFQTCTVTEAQAILREHYASLDKALPPLPQTEP
jgi:antagonist of KipI